MLEEIVAEIKALPEQKIPALRAIRKRVTSEVRNWEADDVMNLAMQLLEHRDVVRQVVVFEIVAHHKPTLATLKKRELEKLGRYLSAWDEVDPFAVLLSGRAWRDGQISDAVVHRWAASKDRWWRRTALVSTVALNLRSQGGQGDLNRTLAVCDLLLDDRDDMVVKAMSWALRELIWFAHDETAEYVERNANRLAARVKREVANKLTTGKKNR